MKLSNKILLGLIGAILLYTLMSLAELRLRGKYINSDDSDLLVESKPTGKYKFLIVDSLEAISIFSSSEPRIELKSMSGGLLGNLKITSDNDTLRVGTSLINKEKPAFVNIYIPDEVMYIQSSDGQIELKEFDQSELTIVQSDGSFRIQEKVKIKRLRLVGNNNTRFYLNSSFIQELELSIDDSRMNINEKIPAIKGTLKNNSKLTTNGFNSLSIKKDDSNIVLLAR